MMVGPVAIGLIAACVAFAPLWIWQHTASTPLWALVVAVVVAGLTRLKYREFDGTADLAIHIHSPATPDSSLRWCAHGLASFLLAICGAPVGSEGAAAEWGHAWAVQARSRSQKWQEQRRRTDAAVTLGAAVSAAFLSPFAAVLLPMELGLGGRASSVVLSAVTAFLAEKFLLSKFEVDSFSLSGGFLSFHLADPAHWGLLLAIASAAAVFSAALIHGYGWIRRQKSAGWQKSLLAGAFLVGLAWAHRSGQAPPWVLLHEVLSGQRIPQESVLIFAVESLGLLAILYGFGTIGIFWPIFTIGGILGELIHAEAFSGTAGFLTLAGLLGSSALWGALLGAPISGGLVAWELSGNPGALFPCLLSAFAGHWIRGFLSSRSLLDVDLKERGLVLIQGRSASVLDTVQVCDAMVADIEPVSEHEPVIHLRQRLEHSRYPFLPVLNSSGKFVGLLSIDQIQDAWHRQENAVGSANSPLSQLLEAKDLLYRAKEKVPSVKSGDPLSRAARLLGNQACVPVLDGEEKIVGLIFAYSVRLAYDREVARRSLSLEIRMGG